MCRRPPACPPSITTCTILYLTSGSSRVRSSVARSLASLGAAITIACGAGQDAAHDEPRPEPDPNVVVHPADAWEQLPILEIDSLPLVTIGAVDEPGHALRNVAAAIIAGDLLLIADGASAEVRAFRLDGSLVRRFGRRGQGDGESESLRAIQLTGDTLIVFDGAGRRMHLFSLAGDRLATVSLVIAPDTRFQLPDGSLAGLATGDEVPDSASGVRRAHAHVLLRTSASADADTLTTLLAGEAWVTPGPGGNVSWILPFGRTPRILFDDLHAVITCENDFGFRFVPWDGSDQRTVRIDLAPHPVTELDVARYRDAWGDHALERDRAFALRFGSLPPDIFFRQYIPECGDARIASDGRIWIGEYTFLDTVPREWTVFSPAGDLVSRIRLPPGFRTAAVTPDHITAIRTGANGADRVAVFRNPLPR